MGSSPTHDLDALRARDEAAHASVLAWLLDPREGHGFGDAVARELQRLVLGGSSAHEGDAVASVEPRPHAHGQQILIKVRTDSRPNAVVLEPLHGRSSGRDVNAREGARRIRWSDVADALEAACDAVKRGRPSAPGLSFVKAYIELLEGSVVERWRGFDLSALDPHLIAAASRYLTCKPHLLEELARFCEAVRREVGSPDGWVSRVGSEMKWEAGVVLNGLYYAPGTTAAARSLCVSLCFWTSPTRPGHLELWLGADTRDPQVVERWRSELGSTGCKQLFGPRALFRTTDGYSEVCELVPRDVWHVNGAASSRRAVACCRDRLLHYLAVSSTAPVFPQHPMKPGRRPEGSPRAA